ncbi:hypothetical protein [Algibacillus agarilyticus]|uniref:hypothetical protein n=1 Tax=Algibacillus agarilyticus TaxID=2234133 RepID=UPI000DCFAEF9|nr:hypothetical protein [Algibacillus agarilyticus]
MEMYGLLILDTESTDEVNNVKNKISELDESNGFSFEQTSVKQGQTLLRFMSDSSARFVLEDLFFSLKDQGEQFARASLTGDEDPFLILYLMEEGEYFEAEIDPSRIEYLVNLDEDELDEDDRDLLKNPKAYYQESIAQWQAGIKIMDYKHDQTDIIKEVYEAAIEESESMLEMC